MDISISQFLGFSDEEVLSSFNKNVSSDMNFENRNALSNSLFN